MKGPELAKVSLMKMESPLLLTVDIGNSNVTFGVFESHRLVKTFRTITQQSLSSDDYAKEIKNHLSGYLQQGAKWQGAVICSVVKPLTSLLTDVCSEILQLPVMTITHDSITGISIHTEKPSETGTDRIVNAAAAFARYGGPCVVVDMGTATTFDVVTEYGVFLGGAIVAGLGLMAESLHTRTSQLPMISLEIPEKSIGRNTTSAMQSGVVLGYIALIEGLLQKIEHELGQQPKIILTGGYAELFRHSFSFSSYFSPHLTLEGCKMIFELNTDF